MTILEIEVVIDMNNRMYISNPPPERWLNDNVGMKYIDWSYQVGGIWSFAQKSDATLFKLTWG